MSRISCLKLSDLDIYYFDLVVLFYGIYGFTIVSLERVSDYAFVYAL